MYSSLRGRAFKIMRYPSGSIMIPKCNLEAIYTSSFTARAYRAQRVLYMLLIVKGSLLHAWTFLCYCFEIFIWDESMRQNSYKARKTFDRLCHQQLFFMLLHIIKSSCKHILDLNLIYFCSVGSVGAHVCALLCCVSE